MTNPPDEYRLKVGEGRNCVITLEGCDEVTMTEIRTRIFPAIRRIVTEGQKRAQGQPVKRPCGCGD
ncbi:MAG: hypothetical protein GC165_00340 [Armatimonadetes bacterium]|nr:hypothetical protein [Armatimonadota bacterium]